MFWTTSVFEKVLELLNRHGRGAGLAQATYGFLGVPGDGATSPNGAGTVTETITLGGRSETVVFTAEASNASLYQMTSTSQNGRTQTLTPGANSPTFAFAYDNASQTTLITETINHQGSTETEVFASGTNGYSLAQDTVTIANPTTTGPNGSTLSYAFAANGQETVTTGHGAHSHTQTLPTDPTAIFTGLATNTGSAANTITESVITGDSVVVESFVGSQSAGYALSQTSTTYIPNAGGTASLNVDEFDRADFHFAAGTVAWVGPNGSSQTQSLTANSHIAFADLGALGTSGDFVGETVTHGQQSCYEIFYSSTGASGEYMQVANGSGAAAAQDLSGLTAQIAAVNALHPFAT